MTLSAANINGVWFLSGAIDETVDLKGLGVSAPVVFNLANITSINSMGIGELVRFATDVGYENITYAQCPPVFVNIFNTVSALLKGSGKQSKVESIVVPFICKKCDATSMSIVKIADIKIVSGSFDLPPKTCSRCQSELEADFDPKEVFTFLT